MPFCPLCRFEYRKGFTECADCGATLVDTLEPLYEQELHVGASSDVVVARCDGEALAEMWAEWLGREGIACRLVPILRPSDSFVPQAMGPQVEIRVAWNDAERARDILPPQHPASATPE
jgi:hypothetical protein